VRLLEIHGGRELARRLRALGLGRGDEIEVLHQGRSGTVIRRDGIRVAIGAGIAAKLLVEAQT
jgi:ferrous iron transport protein A